MEDKKDNDRVFVMFKGTPWWERLGGLKESEVELNELSPNIAGENEMVQEDTGVEITQEVQDLCVEEGTSHDGDYKTSGMLNVYRSVTFPIEVGCLKLKLENDEGSVGGNSSGATVNVEWHGDSERENGLSSRSTTASTAKSPSSSAGHVNSARASAVIRRRQQRRHRQFKNGTLTNCLSIIMSFMYFTGFSPYQPRAAWKPPKWLARMLKYCYWIFWAIALLHAVRDLKFVWIGFREENSFGNFFALGMCLLTVVVRLYSAKIFRGNEQRLKTMDHLINKMETRESSRTVWYRVAVACLVGTSLAMTMTSVMFGPDWNLSEQQLQMSYEISEDIFVWSPNNLTNVKAGLKQQFGRNFSGPVIAFATIGTVMSTIGKLHENLMVDFWAVVASQVYILQADVWSQLQELNEEVIGMDQVWDLYLERRAIFDEMNDAFHPGLKLVHLQNVLRLSKCLFHLLHQEFSSERVIMIITLVKIGVCYWLAIMASNTNDQLEAVVVNRADTNGFVDVNGVKIKLYALRADMQLHLLGLGRGNFHIDESFIIKVICAGWSVFLMAQDHE